MIENKYKWNIAFNFIMKIKRTYENKFKEIKEYNLSKWIEELNINEFNNFRTKVILNHLPEKNLVLIKYSLTSAGLDLWDNPNSVLREMRSLVIDLKNEEIVLAPFRKFFNMNETEETAYEVIVEKIKNASNIEFSNKLDGSMQSARFYRGKIVMSGSGAIEPEASEQLAEGISWMVGNYKKMVEENEQYTFNFEHISQADIHVVSYGKDEQGLYLIGMRNVYTGEQLSYKALQEYAKKYDVKMAELEDVSLDEILKIAEEKKSDEKEGWVLNISGELVKIKCSDYLQIHGILSKLSSINLIIRSIADGNFDDILSRVPAIYKPRVLSSAKLVYDYVNNTEAKLTDIYNKIPVSVKQDRKRLAEYIVKTVDKKYKEYIWKKYDGIEYNLLKKYEFTDSPQYITMKKMGYDVNYSVLFEDEE